MVNDSISKWIDEGLKKGYSKEELRKKLSEKGYSKEDIDNCLRNYGIKKIIPAAIIAVIIIASIFLYFQLKPSQKSEQEKCIEQNIQSCNAILGVNKCGNNQDCLHLYYIGKAIRENDTKECDRITNEILKNLCKNYVNEDTASCTGEFSEQCITLISSRKNAELCKNLSDSLMKGICFMFSTQDKEYCSYMAEECPIENAGEPLNSS